MRLFVTGGNGFLGRHLRRAATDDSSVEVIAPPSTELDVRDEQAVLAAVAAARPDAVVHLAYRTNEWHTNADGSRHIARAAARAGARLVHLSTDVVFGDRAAAYVEHDEPCPAHDYGRSKAAAEVAVRDAAPDAVLVRTSLLYGDDDLARIQLDVADAIAGRSAMRFFTDEVRAPVFAGDLSLAVLRLVGELADVAGPLHLGGPDALTRADLAARFATHLGLSPDDVPTASAAALGLDRSRPLRVVLDSSRATGLGLHLRPVDDVLG